MTKTDQKTRLKEAKELATKHDGKEVVTAWLGTSQWTFVGLGKGVRGRIVGWGLDGPRIEVDDAHRGQAPVSKFHPGGTGENWGEGRTWNFLEEKK